MKFYLISLCLGITCSIRVPTIWHNDRDETKSQYPIIQTSDVRLEPNYDYARYYKLISQLNSPLDLNYSPDRVYQKWVHPPRVNKGATTNKSRKSNETLKSRKRQSNVNYGTIYGQRQPVNSTNININKSLRKLGNVYTPKESNVQQSIRRHHVTAPNSKVQIRNHKDISRDNWVPILDPTISKQKNFSKKQRARKNQRKIDTFSELERGSNESKRGNDNDNNKPLKRSSQLRNRNLNNKGDKIKSERNYNDEYGYDAYDSSPINFDERARENKDNAEGEFVPYRSYAQVRKSESGKHFPLQEAEDMRLKETVKDSKIHTVYVEEGYEDGAYDHGNRKKEVDTAEKYVDISEEEVSESGTFNNNFKKNEEKSDEIKDDRSDLPHIERKDEAQYANANGEPILKQRSLKNMKENHLDNIESVQVDSQNVELNNNNNSTEISLDETTDEVQEKKKNAKKMNYTGKKGVTVSSTNVEDDEDIKRHIDWDPEVLPSRRVKVKSDNRRNSRRKGVHNITPRDVSKMIKNLSNFEINSDKKFNEKKIPLTIRKKSHIVESEVELMKKQTDFEGNIVINYDVEKESALKKNTVPVSTQQKSRLRRDIDQTKFPYYNSERLEKNSALRYAENIENKPDKRRDDMAFYNKAEHNFNCYEDASNFVQQPTLRNEEKSKSYLNSLSGKLGDKINCLKSKYFGDEPFDNPLFSEKDVKSLLEVEQNSRSFSWLQKTAPRKATVERNEATDIDDSKDRFKRIHDDEEGKLQIPNEARNIKTEDKSEISSLADENIASEAQALMIPRRRRRRRRKRPINRFPSHFTSSHNSYIAPDTSFDSYMPTQMMSEVHYKDEIKPSEQMNVFADIINNIKNSSNDLDANASDQSPIVAVRKPSTYRKKRPTYREKLHSKYERRPSPIWEGEVVSNDSFYPIVTTHKHPSSDVIYEDHSVHSNKIPLQTSVHKSQTSYDDDKFDPQSTYLDLYNDPQTSQKRYNKENENYFSYPMPHSERTKNVDRRPHNTENRVQTHAEDSDYSNSGNHRQTYKELNVKPSADIFYVVGMRPPPQNIVHPHQLSYGHLKRRRFTNPRHRRIVKRSTSYLEINRTKQKANIPEGDDDYVPKRSRSFHYDPSTGKIVYDKKEEVEETYEYIDVVEDETTTAVPKKTLVKGPNFSPEPPEGPSFVDFIKVLRANPNYRDIPDPKPTEKAEFTTLASTSTVLVPTAPPEFISILAKIRSDAKYKIIENEKPQSKTTISSALHIDERGKMDNVEDIGEVETFVEHPQNSRNYNVRTQIDYSKYKTIDRGSSLRNNISSRYTLLGKSQNEEAEDSVLIHKDGNRPDVRESNKSEDDDVSSSMHNMEETKITQYIEKLTPETTTISITTKSYGNIPSRGRRRFTTLSPSSSSTEIITVKNQRGRNRRRKIAASSTEGSLRSRHKKIAPSTEDPVRSRRYLTDTSRRNGIVPGNHKETYSSITSSDLPDSDHFKSVVATPRPVTNVVLNYMNVLTKNNLTAGAKNFSKIPENQTSSVDVFKDYDRTKKHGGNYRYEKVEIKKTIQRRNYSSPEAYEVENVEEVSRLTDVVPKPFAFYSDPQLPRDVNELREMTNESGVNYLEYTSDDARNVGERDASEKDVEGKEYKVKQTKQNKYETHDVDEDERDFKVNKRGKHEENDRRNEDIPDSNNKDIYEDILHHHVQSVQSKGKSAFIKDPSQRFYFYAPI